MTQTEMIMQTQTLCQNDPEATDGVLTMYLSQAAATILGHLYRAYGAAPEGASVPAIYQYDQCELAARYFLRRGGQGELAHNENGVNRTYGSVDDQDILRRVMPFARVM